MWGGKASWGPTFKQSPKDEANIQQVRDGKRGVVRDVLGSLSLLRLKQKVKINIY